MTGSHDAYSILACSTRHPSSFTKDGKCKLVRASIVIVIAVAVIALTPSPSLKVGDQRRSESELLHVVWNTLRKAVVPSKKALLPCRKAPFPLNKASVP